MKNLDIDFATSGVVRKEIKNGWKTTTMQWSYAKTNKKCPEKGIGLEWKAQQKAARLPELKKKLPAVRIKLKKTEKNEKNDKKREKRKKRKEKIENNNKIEKRNHT